MVLILSNNSDQSTSMVIDWLDFYQQQWVRINEDDVITISTLEYEDNKLIKFEITINGEMLNLLTITSYWFRRGYLNYDGQRSSDSVAKDPIMQQNIAQYLNDEIDNVFEFVHLYLRYSKRCINSYLSKFNNKTYYQFIASQVGLLVPDSLLCCSKAELKQFKHNASFTLITKSINESMYFNYNNLDYYASTCLINEKNIQQANSQFFPSFFQRYIDKFIELRVFYVHEEIYAMAIFSQQNEQTKIDYRKYDERNPNRNVPFILPEEIQMKLTIFMHQINLDCGSLDLILTQDNKYIFLEVNPIGQFGMVSLPCNYQLEKRLAEILIQIDI